MSFTCPPYIARVRYVVKKIARWILLFSGAISLLMIILSFTSLPFWGYYWLGTSAGQKDIKPDYILVMGGSAMPGKSTLIRSYYAAAVGIHFPDSKIIVALPGDLSDSSSSVNLTIKELEMRGVRTERILVENKGKNTRYQALEVRKLVADREASVLIVTSPEHIRRAVLSFRKAGFLHVAGLPAFDQVSDFDLKFNDKELGGRNHFLPEIGGNIQIRYRFWQYLEYEILITRECLALGFYFLKGWI
jgi:uncharacterized SAM-binding protein YcdF (DUF218 family)